MFDPLKLLKSRGNKDSITSLNLRPSEAEQPKQPAARYRELETALPANTPPAIRQAYQETVERLKGSTAQEEIQRRAMRMKEESKGPRQIFTLHAPGTGNPIALLQKEPASRSLLLFSSPHMANFYRSIRKMAVDVVMHPADRWAESAADWQRRGFDSFILDLSPKAPTFTIYGMQNHLVTADQLAFTWCLQRSIRDWQAQRDLVSFYAKDRPAQNAETLKRQRAVLEALRDFGSFDVPFVHWMIALLAGMQGDEAERLASTDILEQFGPDFVGRAVPATNAEEMKGWGQSMILATMGLLSEYGMLRGPDGT